ncbi:hypothetical protein GDO78_007044 [Eleutherodactylus coqui]|uniref:Uncharacterized protein n=1 Tax=Eleutherodactylus coqui TaxID=57060 RepID=A0A8J6FFA9_ELECQ|nr:hypothetical protein GDO78_007044 [Eleutherodactylus coqui]
MQYFIIPVFRFCACREYATFSGKKVIEFIAYLHYFLWYTLGKCITVQKSNAQGLHISSSPCRDIVFKCQCSIVLYLQNSAFSSFPAGFYTSYPRPLYVSIKSQMSWTRTPCTK